MTGVSKGAVLRVLDRVGTDCAEYQDRVLRNIRAQRVQCDEIWSFVAAKQKNVTVQVAEREPAAGDVWTWVGMDADTKLAISWWVGLRDWQSAKGFIQDLQGRLAKPHSVDD
jgi:hypothetical protein